MPDDTTTLVRRADVCAVAVAECFRGDGAEPGQPHRGDPHDRRPPGPGQLRARPDDDRRRGDPDRQPRGLARRPRTGSSRRYNPYRRMFDVVWSGRRHVMMGATQVDRYGNQNIAALGPDPHTPDGPAPRRPGRPGQHHQRHHQLLGRPPRPQGVRRGRRRGVRHRLRPGRRARARRPPAGTRSAGSCRTSASSTSRPTTTACGSGSLHPGVTVDEVQEATGFDARRPRRRRRDAASPPPTSSSSSTPSSTRTAPASARSPTDLPNSVGTGPRGQISHRVRSGGALGRWHGGGNLHAQARPRPRWPTCPLRSPSGGCGPGTTPSCRTWRPTTPASARWTSARRSTR